jgi:hypothetical protein
MSLGVNEHRQVLQPVSDPSLAIIDSGNEEAVLDAHASRAPQRFVLTDRLLKPDQFLAGSHLIQA